MKTHQAFNTRRSAILEKLFSLRPMVEFQRIEELTHQILNKAFWMMEGGRSKEASAMVTTLNKVMNKLSKQTGAEGLLALTDLKCELS